MAAGLLCRRLNALPTGETAHRRTGECIDKRARCAFLYHIAERKEAMGRPITKRQSLSASDRTTRRREYRKDRDLSQSFGGCPSVPSGRALSLQICG